MRAAAVLAATAVALSLTGAPALADPEVEILECEGTLPPDAVRGRYVTGSGTIVCTHRHAGTAPSAYDEWFISALTSTHENVPVAGSEDTLFQSTGVVEFSGLGEQFALVYTDLTVCDVTTLGGNADQIRFSSSDDLVYYVRAGYIDDAIAAACVPVSADAGTRKHHNYPATFRFVAEYAHEVPL